MEDYPPYPYQRIKNEEGLDVGVVALIAPFYDLTYYRVRPGMVSVRTGKDLLSLPVADGVRWYH